jgi:hypothetical protein
MFLIGRGKIKDALFDISDWFFCDALKEVVSSAAVPCFR